LAAGALEHRGRHAKIFGWAKSAAYDRRYTNFPIIGGAKCIVAHPTKIYLRYPLKTIPKVIWDEPHCYPSWRKCHQL